MDFAEAVNVIEGHAGQIDDERMETGFVAVLRPYTGLVTSNFEEIMEALAAVAPHLCEESRVDKRLVRALWGLCATARRWGTHPQSMLPRNHLISTQDVATLEDWSDIIEGVTIRCLQGNAPAFAFSRYYERVASGQSRPRAKVFVALMISALSLDDADLPVIAAEALGQMGEMASPAIPALEAAVKIGPPNVHRAAAMSLQRIRTVDQSKNDTPAL